MQSSDPRFNCPCLKRSAKFVAFAVTLLCFGLGLASASHAAPIRFTFEGNADIHLDAESFSGAFRIEALADTDDVDIFIGDTSDIVFVSAGATILGPFGTGTFSQPVQIRSIQAKAPGFTSRILLSANGELFSVSNPIFGGFHLDSALGPVALGDLPPIASEGAQLDIGRLGLTHVRNLQFTSTPIPEPSTALLLFGGLIGLRLTRRRPA